jgi:hypothetical protein
VVRRGDTLQLVIPFGFFRLGAGSCTSVRLPFVNMSEKEKETLLLSILLYTPLYRGKREPRSSKILVLRNVKSLARSKSVVCLK